MDLSIALSYSQVIAGVKNSYLSVGKSWKNVGNIAIGLNYVDYGNFDGYDEYETAQGTFSGSRYGLLFTVLAKLISRFFGWINYKTDIFEI